MAGQRQRILVLLIIFSLSEITEQFEVKENELEDLTPNIAALYRLRGLSDHMSHDITNTPETRIDIKLDLLGPLQELQNMTNFTNFFITKEQDFRILLAHVEKQKTDNWLLAASDISHSYSQKILVMIDEESSTTDRVRQEYSMDPHYSVIVSTQCLFNQSCVPDVDRYAVVKIFGSVSEDGQTVSGLSGSSLATMILKTSMESASVFSLDGYTTREFQHNFIQHFMRRGLMPVLETSQNNQNIYQVIDQHNSISKYQIPKRPVDHSTQYDHQQILMLQDDQVVRNAATFLYEKHPLVSSVYVLDKLKPKLIAGKDVPLSEDSRLVLVGHGAKEGSEEMRLAKYTSKAVAEIIQSTSRVSDKIKTVSVVACDVGSDKSFVESLAKEIHGAGIETELHLRNSVLQVQHTGEKITQEISPNGNHWKHKDDSKKVIATIDRNGDVFIREEPSSRGLEVFTNEKNCLVEKSGKTRPAIKTQNNHPQDNKSEWPVEPMRFIDPKIYTKCDQNKVHQIKHSCEELERLSWAIFQPEGEDLPKVSLDNLQNERYLDRTGEVINKPAKVKEILQNCCEIGKNIEKSGAVIRDIIRSYAKSEGMPLYVMIDDWIFSVDPKNLYVHPAGKKINNNDDINELKKLMASQSKAGSETYSNIRNNIKRPSDYTHYVRNVFHGEERNSVNSITKFWYAWYFTASVISESARNVRTFPLILMALEMAAEFNKKGVEFLYDKHSMARGGSWPDQTKRGFFGTAAPTDTINQMSEGAIKSVLEVIDLESVMFTGWEETLAGKTTVDDMAQLLVKYKIFQNEDKRVHVNYNDFKTKVSSSSILTPSGDEGRPSTSGVLGGYNDGYVTTTDLSSATALENTFKHESYYLGTSVSFAEEIYTQLKLKHGEALEKLHLQEGSARIEEGHFVCKLLSKDAGVKPVEFRAALSQESLHYYEKMVNNIETSVHDMEMMHSSAPSHQNKFVEHSGTAVGMLGLMLGMKGAAQAFEHGDIEDGVMGSLQTAHGVLPMATYAISKQVLTSETKIAKSAARIIKSPAMRRAMVVIPVVGVGLGIYNIEQDLKRNDTLGYIDAGLDSLMTGLDIVGLAVPVAEPFLAPINLALSIVRMAIDDIYMGIQNELNSLPNDAGVLAKMKAVLIGIGEGVFHFAIHVASIFYDWHYDEIENGQRLVAEISDYHKYYKFTQEDNGRTAIDFQGGSSSCYGGNITFCLADQGQSNLCMDYFVSSDESYGRKCWSIDAHGSQDIILGLGESQVLEHQTLKKKVFLFIPVGSVTVVSGLKAASNSRYGKYKGNQDSNNFFAVQEAADKHMAEVMLDYYYELYGEPGDDIFYLGPQRSYVEGSGGKDTYVTSRNGCKTTINNYDFSKELDTLHFSGNYNNISVHKSGDDVKLMYEGNHMVTIQNWFLGEAYRHMNMMSADGVLFEIYSTVITSVQLLARGINKRFMKKGTTVNASVPLLHNVTSIFGSQYDDILIGNAMNNLIDGGGGQDRLCGGEGEDVYLVKDKTQSSVMIENFSRDNKSDLIIVEANLHTFQATVEGDDIHLSASIDSTAIHVTLVKWFTSSANRHLLIVTKDLIMFAVSSNQSDCLQGNLFSRCIRSSSIDYSNSSTPLVKDLQDDDALDGVTEVRGSQFDDVIKANKQANVLIPGRGNDFMEGREGEDWYIITPGQGVKTINNQSPDWASDILFLQVSYENLKCVCEGQNLVLRVLGQRTVIIQNWFGSRENQHLQIKTSDGITAELMTNTSSCDLSLMLPLTIDYREQRPEPLQSSPEDLQKSLAEVEKPSECYCYRNKDSERLLCGLKGKVMKMDEVKEMFGSSGFDIMVGNKNGNLIDPHTGGGLMFGGEGQDTYVIKQGYGNNLLIDNFAEDNATDTVLVNMDFLDGSQVILNSSATDLNVTIITKEEELRLSLLGYNNDSRNQHLEFQSADGVRFQLKVVNAPGDVPVIQTEAFKVTLKKLHVDCRLDLSSLKNLSKVHTVQGCPSQSNNILGNIQDNTLIGGWKDDILEGGEGDDTLIGGIGADILVGGMGDDTLYGDDGNDTLLGDSGWDVFIPGPGADLVDGGSGRDTVLYRGDPQRREGVYVNLLSGQGQYADAEGDVLKDVEIVIGTIYSDILVSGYESSLLKGSDGNDLLVSMGNDYLVGGEGNDIYLLAFTNGTTTIDNCAKDNATDVLHFNSMTLPSFDCQLLSDRVVLTFFGSAQAKVKVGLRGWVRDEDECGHLMVVSTEVEASVDTLLQECERRQKMYVSWNVISISALICIGSLSYTLF